MMVDFESKFPTLDSRIQALASMIQDLFLQIFPRANFSEDADNVGSGYWNSNTDMVFVISPQ
jgi:hypothetical protein